MILKHFLKYKNEISKHLLLSFSFYNCLEMRLTSGFHFKLSTCRFKAIRRVNLGQR